MNDATKFIFCVVIDIVFGQQQQQQNRNRRGKGTGAGQRRRGGTGPINSDAQTRVGLIVIGILFALCIIPPFASFLYAVVRDPLTPQLIKNAMDGIKEKSFGYLSTTKVKSKSKTK